MSNDARKMIISVPDKGQHKPACTVTEKLYILVFWIYVEKESYYLRSENKGADQLCSNCTADLCLCFRIGKIDMKWPILAQSIIIDNQL